MMAGRISRSMMLSPQSSVIARSEATKQSTLFFPWRHGFLRFARNDGMGLGQMQGYNDEIDGLDTDERDDDQRIEDDRRQDGALRACQMHDVEHGELRVERQEHRRDNRKIFCDVS